jgi:hypothetical protein
LGKNYCREKNLDLGSINEDDPELVLKKKKNYEELYQI